MTFTPTLGGDNVNHYPVRQFVANFFATFLPGEIDFTFKLCTIATILLD